MSVKHKAAPQSSKKNANNNKIQHRGTPYLYRRNKIQHRGTPYLYRRTHDDFQYGHHRSRSFIDNGRNKQKFDTKLFLIELAIYLMIIALVINITPPNLSQRDKYFYVMKYDGVNIPKTKITSSSQNKAEVDVDTIYATKLRMMFRGPVTRNNNDDEKKKKCKKADKEFIIHGSIEEYEQYVEEMG